eukprot:CAMPEP_0194295924 /NCGR_PEP_ID=MMETSP0169-20130528/54729_1 /TAXON_ID=218684 /ORGANISM="Corethron pennatum, Strain L29A3" /LENGTH=85 /DNA_ID=CAMNT_0039045221 /DNA_START=70 /DNA_END=324 /DNA_ORIENTATION=-
MGQPCSRPSALASPRRAEPFLVDACTPPSTDASTPPPSPTPTVQSEAPDSSMSGATPPGGDGLVVLHGRRRTAGKGSGCGAAGTE